MAIMDDIRNLTPLKCLLIGGGLMVGYYFMIFDQGVVQMGEIAQIEKEIAKKQASMTEVNKAMADKEAFQREADQLAQEYARLTAYMPEELDINAFQKELSIELQNADNKIQTMKNENVISRFPGFAEHGLSMQSVGSFHSIMKFMSSVTKMNRIVDFTNMEFNSIGNDDESSQIQFRTIMSVFSKDVSAEKNKKSEPGK